MINKVAIVLALCGTLLVCFTRQAFSETQTNLLRTISELEQANLDGISQWSGQYKGIDRYRMKRIGIPADRDDSVGPTSTEHLDKARAPVKMEVLEGDLLIDSHITIDFCADTKKQSVFIKYDVDPEPSPTVQHNGGDKRALPFQILDSHVSIITPAEFIHLKPHQRVKSLVGTPTIPSQLGVGRLVVRETPAEAAGFSRSSMLVNPLLFFNASEDISYASFHLQSAKATQSADDTRIKITPMVELAPEYTMVTKFSSGKVGAKERTSTWTIVVARDVGYNVIRHETRHDDKPYSDTTITYRSVGGQFVPNHYRTVKFRPDGTIHSERDVTLQRSTVNEDNCDFGMSAIGLKEHDRIRDYIDDKVAIIAGGAPTSVSEYISNRGHASNRLTRWGWFIAFVFAFVAVVATVSWIRCTRNIRK